MAHAPPMTALPDKTSMLKASQSHRSPTNFTMACSHYQQGPTGQDEGVVDVGWSGCCQRSFLQQGVDSQAADMSPSPVVFLRQVSAGVSSRTSSCSQAIRGSPHRQQIFDFLIPPGLSMSNRMQAKAALLPQHFTVQPDTWSTLLQH